MWIEKLKDFIRALQRPYVIFSGWGVVLAMAWMGRPIPDFLLAFVSTLTGFLFAERAVRHNN